MEQAKEGSEIKEIWEKGIWMMSLKQRDQYYKDIFKVFAENLSTKDWNKYIPMAKESVETWYPYS